MINKKSLKTFIRKLIPKGILHLRRVIRDGKVKLKEYISKNKLYRNERKYTADDFPFYLSVVLIVKNETPYIAEWIEYHLLVGVQKFFIYDNESTDNLRSCLEPYIRDGIVEYIHFPGCRPQNKVYNDAINRHKYSSFWLAIIDIDEFLVPLTTESIAQFLRDFEDVPGIEINQVLYGSGGNQKKTDGLVIERFKNHSPFNHSSNRTIKSIVNPRHVLYMATAHVAEYFGGKYSVNTDKVYNTEASLERPALHDKVRYNHYFLKSFEEFTSKAEKGRVSLPEKLSVDDFYKRDFNDIKNDTIMDKYVQRVKRNIKQRFG